MENSTAGMGWVCNGNLSGAGWSNTLAAGDITDLAVRRFVGWYHHQLSKRFSYQLTAAVNCRLGL